jgi:thymidylate kinase
MPLSPADDQILAICYRNLKEEPIEPGHRFYVEIWEHSEHDPVRRLQKHIVWSEVESLQLFSGFSGSGKSTQLLRLRQNLQAEGYLVVYATADDYLNLGEPIEVEDLLITIAGAFSDKLDPSLEVDSYWDRLVNYLVKTEVNGTEVTFKLSAASFKAELKASPTFRQRVRKVIQSHLPEIKRQVHAFVQEAVKAARKKDQSQRIVFLFDSFEKLRGTPSNEQEIMASIERLFGSHMDMLQLPDVHCVYSVPAFVQFFVSYGELVIIPTIKIWTKRLPDGAEAPHQPGLSVLRSILEKRLGIDAQRRIFGEPDSEGRHQGIDNLIAASGGALRDLLRLFREALLAAQTLPVTDKVIQQAIATVGNDFKTSIEDARWLHKIHQEQAADPETSKASDVNRYMRLLDSHLILYYRNDSSWYDSHPLVRAEVERILAANPEAKE